MSSSISPKNALRTALFGITIGSTAFVNASPRFVARAPFGHSHTSNPNPRYTLNERDGTVQPSQPAKVVADGLIGGFEEVGKSLVSAQQLFLGNDHLVYIVDKAEDNPTTINGHAAWASVYDLNTNQAIPLEVVTNTFCAGGTVAGNGQWINVGGNKAVRPGGFDNVSQTGDNEYQNSDGRFSVRTILPGDGAEWGEDPAQRLTTPRWYPSLETLEDGRVIIIGGDNNGGFVNDAGQNNPTFEFYPRAQGAEPQFSEILNTTLPANLYAITHLLPSGKLFVNSNHKACKMDYTNGDEVYVDDVPHAVRTYPASASSAMLPMNKANDWTATIMYCGGVDMADNEWTQAGKRLIDIPGSKSCVKISPDVSGTWEEDDDLPEGRVMGNGILLPDGTVLIVNGAEMGVAGYSDATQEAWAVDDSLATNPTFTPVIYDPKKPAGQRWSRQGLKASPIARMYHSGATLLPDGSVFIAGSNPHPDFTDTAIYPTEYRVEIFYPLYYNKRRPEPSGLPTSLSYGGNYFDVKLSKDDLGGDAATNVKTVTIAVMKTGFSTHALNFGMRMVELDYSYSVDSDGGATLHVSQLPPNPAIIQPGPAWLYVNVNGVPSVGIQVMLGTGNIETQPITEAEILPQSKDVPDSSNDESRPNAGLRTTGIFGYGYGLTLTTLFVALMGYAAI